MRRVSVLGLAAVVGTCVAVSACGQQRPGVTAGPPRSHPSAPSSSAAVSALSCAGSHAARPAKVTITSADSGKTLCVARGSTVLVILRGTPGHLWSPIHAGSTVLVPRANGEMMLMLGETGASFAAARPGKTTVTSTRPACPGSDPAGRPSPSSPAGNSAPVKVECGALVGFSTTVVVQ